MLERIAPLNRERPDIQPSDAYQGVIDRLDPACGVEGWCVAAGDAESAVELELLVNGLVYRRATADLPRRDVAEHLGLREAIGFAFEPAALDRLIDSRKTLEPGAIAVRVANTSLLLRCAEGVSGLDSWLEARAALLEAEDEPATLQRLRRRWEDAAPLLDLPGGVGASAEIGVMEMAAPGSGGIVWFSGWLKREWVGDACGVVIGGRKFAAGVTTAPFERDDLPPEVVGIVGALLSDWRPTQRSEAILKLGADVGGFLRILHPLRLSRAREILAHLPAGPAARELSALAEVGGGWDYGAGSAGADKAAVDLAAGLEGFGVFMKGWVVSPSRPVKSLALRLGDRLFPCNPSSLYFTPRPDLKSAFPQAGDALDRAGFCCVFECDAPSSLYDDVGLKAVYEDGRVSFHNLPELVINKIAPNGDGGDFRRFYTSFERLPFFTNYALAYYRAFTARFSGLSAENVEFASAQMIFAAPNERHLLYRLFDDLAFRLHDAEGALPGVALLASESARHGEIRYLFEDFQRSYAGACTLIFIPDSRHALAALDAALVLLAARRFVFIGADAALTAPGWRAAFLALSTPARLVLFSTEDPVEPWAPPEASLRAFAWASEAYLDWRRGRRLPIGDPPSARSFGEIAEVEAFCALRISGPTSDSAVNRINEIVGAEI